MFINSIAKSSKGKRKIRTSSSPLRKKKRRENNVESNLTSIEKMPKMLYGSCIIPSRFDETKARDANVIPYFRIVFAGMRLMRAASPRRNTGVGDCEWDDDADGDDARRARERGRAERSQSGRARLRSLSTAGLTSFSSHRRDGRSNLVITLHRFPFFETPNRAPNLARFPYFACEN